jgi:hypothetical protein
VILSDAFAVLTNAGPGLGMERNKTTKSKKKIKKIKN